VTPERWRQVTAVFHAARAREVDERGAVLDQMCGRDSALRADVEALLAGHAEASRAISLDALPQLSVGTLFGPYRIEALVGAGGMGQVYAATDTRLRRTVAIKVLMPDLSADPAFGARFEREAQLLASLNHPNIAAIYGLEAADGVQALVLEFVEGPTLAEHIALVRRVPLTEALGLARQIASALEAAHERGIVHRDLKPSNIKLTPAGAVKVLDFGVARMTAVAGGPRITAGGTGTGVILGTPAYMSPEQARGQPVDKRSDIWAFGCVLYEMLAGKGAFAAETPSDSLAMLIERDPDWTALPAGLPPPIRRLVSRCLQKDPADRIHDAADARIEIVEALSTPAQDHEAAVGRRSRKSMALLALTVATLAALVVGMRWRSDARSSSASPTALEFGVTFPNNFTPADGTAISPDGRHIAANVWSKSGSIWLYSFDGSQPAPLAGGENGAFPFWSPDSTTIGFFRAGQLVTVRPTGGQVTRVAQIKLGGRIGGATWNRDNVIVYADGDGLFRVASSGGTPVEIPIVGISGVLSGPTFLADGRHVVFCAEGPGGGSINLASLDGGAVTNFGHSQCPGGFAPPDHVFFLRDGSLLAQKLDLDRLALEGEPHVVAQGVNRGAAGPWPALTVSASDTGVLAFPTPRGGSSVGQLTWFNRDGKATGAIEAPTTDDAENLNAVISPTNDSLIAANRLDAQTGTWHVWLIDGSRSNAATRLTTDSASDVDPVWSPDGKQILYLSERDGARGFYRQAIAGGAPERVLDVSGFTAPIPSDWSDGYLLFQQLQQSIWALRLGDRAPIRLADRQPQSYGPHLSPDGKWMAYSSARAGAFELFVEGFPGGSPRKQISIGGGVHPRWTKGGKELAYWAPPGGIVSNELTLTSQDIRVGPVKTLVAQPVLTLIDARTHFDITRDGQKILMRQAAGPPSPGIRVIVNWMAKLK
jgi:eukaryotic-like serine/threonine-protein kinase